MNYTNDILIELQQVAPQLAQLQRTEAFRVPTNYFEQLPSCIADNCREATELAQAAPILWAITKSTAFDTPTGYFEWLYDEIMRQTTGKTTGNTEIPQFQAASPTMSVPDTYFDQLHENILAKVRAISADNAPAESNTHSNDNELTDYPQLKGLRQSRAFSVPNNYFETAYESIIQQIAQKPQGRLIQMQQWWSNLQPIARYAAVVAVFVAGYLIGNHNEGNTQLANVMPMSEVMKMFNELTPSEAGLVVHEDGYLDELADDPKLLANINIDQLDDQKWIDDLSPKDIKSYVDERPSDFDQILESQFDDIDLKDLDLTDLPSDLP